MLVLALVGAEPAVAWKAEAVARKCSAGRSATPEPGFAEAGSYAGAGRSFHIRVMVTKVVRHSRYVIFQSDYRIQYELLVSSAIKSSKRGFRLLQFKGNFDVIVVLEDLIV